MPDSPPSCVPRLVGEEPRVLADKDSPTGAIKAEGSYSKLYVVPRVGGNVDVEELEEDGGAGKVVENNQLVRHPLERRKARD